MSSNRMNGDYFALKTLTVCETSCLQRPYIQDKILSGFGLLVTSAQIGPMLCGKVGRSIFLQTYYFVAKLAALYVQEDHRERRTVHPMLHS